MKASELIFLAILCLATAGLCLHAWFVVGQGPLVIAAPAAITLVLLVLAAVRVAVTLRGAPDSAEAVLLAGYWQALRGSFRAMLWCMLAAPLLLAFGYPVGLAVFAALYARVFGAAWRAALLLGAFAFVLVWFGAGRLLGVPLPLLPGWIA